MVLRYVVPVTLAVTLAGCGSIGAIGLPWKRDKAVEPLPAQTTVAPVDGSVQSTDLGPPGDTQVAGLPADGSVPATDQPLAPPGGSTAMTAPSGSGANGSIGR